MSCDKENDRSTLRLQKAHRFYVEAGVCAEVDDYASAVRILGKAIAFEANPLYLALRGHIYKLQGRADRALADYSRAIKLHPRCTEKYVSRGDIYDAMGWEGKALADYNAGLNLEPDNLLALVRRGGYYMRLGQHSEALVDLNLALGKDPNNATLFFYRGGVYEMLGEKEKAVEDFGTAIAIDHVFYDAYCDRGTVLVDLGLPCEAIADLRLCLDVPWLRDGALNSLGLAYQLLGDEELAEKYFKESAEAKSSEAYSHSNLAGVYARRGDFAAALEEIEKAVGVVPDDTSVLFNKSIVCSQLGRYDESLQCLAKIVEIDSSDVKAQEERLKLLAKTGKYVEAYAFSTDVLKDHPTNSVVLNVRAGIYWEWGEYKNALADMDECLKYSDRHLLGEYYRNRGGVLRKLNLYDRAIYDFVVALEINPRAVEAVRDMGRTYMDMGEDAIALEYFDKAILIDPNDGMTYWGRGTAYAHLGNHSQALVDFERAIELGENNPALRQNCRAMREELARL